MAQIQSEHPFLFKPTGLLNEKQFVSASLTWQHGHSHSFSGEGLVHNELGFGSEVERGKSIKVVFVLGCDVGDHDRVRRAAQRVL